MNIEYRTRNIECRRWEEAFPIFGKVDFRGLEEFWPQESAEITKDLDGEMFAQRMGIGWKW